MNKRPADQLVWATRLCIRAFLVKLIFKINIIKKIFDIT